ncbi:MAG TPA: hypothetical protein VJN19_06195, partial [Propionibacteriaceae bacterium]|nr:hypothetical protein [Propionibacteriaceae bacterium]
DHGTTKSLYGMDPDGLEFEIAWIVPADRLDDAALDARKRISRLDLDREIARYGADTRGGIGISVTTARLFPMRLRARPGHLERRT